MTLFLLADCCDTLLCMHIQIVTMLNSKKLSEKGSLKYKSINELLEKAKVNYRGIKPAQIMKRLPEMYNIAEDYRKKGNEEDQYIMLRRWLNAIEWLKTTHEYKDDKIYSSTHLHVNQVGNCIYFSNPLVCETKI